LYTTTTNCIGLLHVEELLEIFQCGICVAEGIVRSKLEQPVITLKVNIINSLSSQFTSPCFQATVSLDWTSETIVFYGVGFLTLHPPLPNWKTKFLHLGLLP
jgi:hypothetical protein